MTTCSTSLCGTGGWTGPRPGDPDNNISLFATPAFGGIDISWSFPSINPQAVSHVQLYRGISAEVSNALLLAVVGGNYYYDRNTSGTTTQYFYWIKVVSVNGTIGDWIGPVSAIARMTNTDILEILTGEIDEGMLAGSLRGSIDKININYQEFLDEALERINTNAALTFALNQVQAGITSAVNYINTEITQRTEGDSAIASSINIMVSANARNLAAIVETYITRVDANSAISQAKLDMAAQTRDVLLGYVNTATLTNNYYTKTDTNSAISQAKLDLTNQTTNTLLNYVSTAALTNNYYTKTDVNTALSVSTQNLVSNTDLIDILVPYALNNDLAAYATTASLSNNYFTKTETGNAISSATTNLVSTTTLNNTLSAYPSNASLQTKLTSQVGYAVKQGTTIPYDGNGSAIIYPLLTYPAATYPEYAADRTRIIDKLGVDRWNALPVGATTPLTWLVGLPLASAIQTAQVTDPTTGQLASVSQAFSAQASLNGKLKAQYTAKVDVNGLIGGFNIYNDGASVEAGFDVDRFWIGRTTNRVKPFIISNGIVHLDKARIGEADIDTLKIAGNAVTIPLFSSFFTNSILLANDSSDISLFGINEGSQVGWAGLPQSLVSTTTYIVSITGRTGFLGTTSPITASRRFAVFYGPTHTQVADNGWSPFIGDTVSFSFILTVPAGVGSMPIEVRCKGRYYTPLVDTTSCGIAITILGTKR